MRGNKSNGSRAAAVRRYIALVAMVAIRLALAPFSAEAAPLAYVANADDCTVSLIDTASNTVVATVPVGIEPFGIAVTPDGRRVYVANFSASLLCPPSLPENIVSVIDTATNTVVATVPVGSNPISVAITPDGTQAYVANFVSNTVSVLDTSANSVVATVALSNSALPAGVAITPDGKHVYVTNNGLKTVSVIDTASKAVVATVPVGNLPDGVAITPDGKKAYVANGSVLGTVSVIDTATNVVVATVPVEGQPQGIAITPDGTLAYVVNFGGNTPASHDVSVIATATNTVVATVPEGPSNQGLAITPDGKKVYVANSDFSNILVIDTATNTVVATVAAGKGPSAVAMGPPLSCLPFLALSAKLELDLEHKPNKDHAEVLSSFTLGSASDGIKPATEPVTLKIGAFTTIPPGSFKEIGLGIFVFRAVIGGMRLEALIAPTGNLRYALVAAAQDANLAGTVNPVPVTLTIGDDCGTASVQALIIH